MFINKIWSWLPALFLCLPIFGQQDSVWNETIDQVVVTAQYAPTDLRESVSSVRIIDREVIIKRGVSTLMELLQAEANIRISQDAILGGTISINGIQGENVKILLDGVPITGRINGNIDINQVPLTDIQRIEIVEGAQSLIYGSDASGGVINLITKKSQLSTVGGSVQALYESNGNRNLAAQLGIQKDKFFINASGQVLTFDPSPDSIGQRDQYWNPKKQSTARTNIRYYIDENSEFRVSGGILKEKISNLGEVRRPQFKPYAFDNYYLLDRGDANVFYQKSRQNHWLMQGSFRYSYYDRIENAFRYDLETRTQQLLEIGQDTNRYSSYNARYTFASDNKSNINYLLGLELTGEKANGNRLLDSTDLNSQFVGNREWGIFASARYKASPHWTIQGGSRWVINENFGSAIVPSMWTSYKANKNLTLRSSLAWGYRSPSLEQLYFYFVDINHYVVGKNNLLPERSINAKIDASYQPVSNSDWQWKSQISTFYNMIKDRIILAQIGIVEFQFRNIETWTTAGANLSTQFSYKNVFKFSTQILRAGYYNQLSQKVEDVPKLGWATDWANEMTYNMGSKHSWSVNIWHKQTGGTPYFYIDKEGVTKQEFVKTWHFVNASISSKWFNDHLILQAGVKNITDIKQLNANIGTANHTDAGNQQIIHWGRTWFANAMYNF
jgi:outer membrane receptor for ferrienterochelin and colicins